MFTQDWEIERERENIRESERIKELLSVILFHKNIYANMLEAKTVAATTKEEAVIALASL